MIICVLFELSEIQFALSNCTISAKLWLLYLFIFLSVLLEKILFASSAKW